MDFFSSGSDHFLVFANSHDNNGETLVTVDVYRWDNTTRLFTPSPWQSLENQGAAAVAVVNIEGVTYMAVANNYNSKLKTYTVQYVWLLEFWVSYAYSCTGSEYCKIHLYIYKKIILNFFSDLIALKLSLSTVECDWIIGIFSSSIVYKLGSNQKFSEHQRIETHGATDASFLQIHSLTLLVLASNRGDVISSPQTSVVYRWDSTLQTFLRHSDIQTNRVNKISPFIAKDNTGLDRRYRIPFFSWIKDKFRMQFPPNLHVS